MEEIMESGEDFNLVNFNLIVSEHKERESEEVT